MKNIRSDVVSSCHKKLLAFKDQLNITLGWLRSHINISGDEKADKLVKKVTLQPIKEAEIGICLLISVVIDIMENTLVDQVVEL